MELEVQQRGTAVFASLRSFFFPRGEDSPSLIRSVRTTQNGEMRTSPEGRWIPFTADETIDATYSDFRWRARLRPRKFGSATVTDAYDHGHGRLVVKIGGILPVKRIVGPDVDRAEIQRYLAGMIFCPPMLLNHPTLEWEAITPSLLRFRDYADLTRATVDWDLSNSGRPLACHATRPRLVGRHSVLTPWTGMGSEFREYDGVRVATCLEAAWHLPEGSFTYYRSDITSFTAMR